MIVKHTSIFKLIVGITKIDNFSCGSVIKSSNENKSNRGEKSRGPLKKRKIHWIEAERAEKSSTEMDLKTH